MKRYYNSVPRMSEMDCVDFFKVNGAKLFETEENPETVPIARHRTMEDMYGNNIEKILKADKRR
jgi:hypothetical protein